MSHPTQAKCGCVLNMSVGRLVIFRTPTLPCIYLFVKNVDKNDSPTDFAFTIQNLDNLILFKVYAYPPRPTN